MRRLPEGQAVAPLPGGGDLPANSPRGRAAADRRAGHGRPVLAGPEKARVPPGAASSVRRSSSARLAAMVGHELRTPLANALLYMSILKKQMSDSASSSSARSALEVVHAEIRRLDNLVVRVTELQGLGRAVIRPRLVDLGVVVAETVGRAQAGDRWPAGRLSLVAARGMIGWWDDTAVEQILQNLLSNALKFGRGRPVQVRLSRTPTGARLVVRDQGDGMDKVQQARIFAPASRLSHRRSGGICFGLWIVGELARAHGGDVGVRSVAGLGARFTVALRELAPTRARGATSSLAARRYRSADADRSVNAALESAR